jgi:hypothetical protein
MSDITPVPPERLFDFEEDDLLQDQAPARVIDVDRILRVICKLKAEIAGYEAALKEAQGFYAQRMMELDARMDFYRQNVENYLRMTHQQKLATPHGTVSLGSRTEHTWPADDVLIAFAKEAGIPHGVIEKPSKKEILLYVKNTGHVPQGYKEEKCEALIIRPRTSVTEEVCDDISALLAA